MFRIEQIIEIGLYDEKQLWREERELMDRFLMKYSITNLKFPLYRYRKHLDNMINNKKMLKKYEKRIEKK